jgi:serine/threonine protein kinase
MPSPAGHRFELALLSGTLLQNRYRIERMLGRAGGFGVAYLAHDLQLEIPVAIKEYLPRELAGRATDRATVLPHSEPDADLFRFGLQQFLREARTLARLDHPNIVRVQNYFEANGTAYLVMSYYEGHTLADQVEREGGRLPPKLAVEIMIRVLDGLRVVHSEKMLHRDVKPENIYLTTDQRVILLDFGAARQAVGQKSQNLTSILTPGYAPVEQYRPSGRDQGAWTDVYACAATLYYIITGEEPPAAPDRDRDDPLVSPAALVPGLAPHLVTAILRGMEMPPQSRPQSVDEFQDLLEGKSAVPIVEEEKRTPVPVDPKPKKKRDNGLVIAGVGSVLVLMLILAVAVAPSGSSVSPPEDTVLVDSTTPAPVVVDSTPVVSPPEDTVHTDPTPATDGPPAGSPERYIVDALAEFGPKFAPGFETTSPYISSLSNGESASLTAELTAGREYRLLGVCDDDCTDLDLVLSTASDSVIVSDTAEDSFPYLSLTPEGSGSYSLTVKMIACKVSPCSFGIGVYTR